jgi:hypothetical protein
MHMHTPTHSRKHAGLICNTYCSSTATMVLWTHLNITLYVHCLSCCILIVLDFKIAFCHMMEMVAVVNILRTACINWKNLTCLCIVTFMFIIRKLEHVPCCVMY